MKLSTLIFLLIISPFLNGQSIDTSLTYKLKGRMGCGNVTAKAPVTDTPHLLTCKIPGVNVKAVSQSSDTRIRLCSRRLYDSSSNPLLVVDYKIVPLVDLANINPNEIARIDILKGAQATVLYGSGAMNGVIVVTMKMVYKKIYIKDAADSSAIAGATVSFDYDAREHSLNYIADEKGVILSNSWTALSNTPMSVSAAGYQSVYYKRPLQDSIIYLEKVLSCDIVLTETNCHGRPLNVRSNEKPKIPVVKKTLICKVFPNPISRDETVTISFDAITERKMFVEVLNIFGKVIYRSSVELSKAGLFRVQTKNSWPAGVYFIRLWYENYQLAASEKIILQ